VRQWCASQHPAQAVSSGSQRFENRMGKPNPALSCDPSMMWIIVFTTVYVLCSRLENQPISRSWKKVPNGMVTSDPVLLQSSKMTSPGWATTVGLK
jgi:hypothetical protein